MSYPGHSGGSSPLQRSSRCILQPLPTGQFLILVGLYVPLIWRMTCLLLSCNIFRANWCDSWSIESIYVERVSIKTYWYMWCDLIRAITSSVLCFLEICSLIVRFHSWRFGEWEEFRHYHSTQIHSDPEKYFQLRFDIWIKNNYDFFPRIIIIGYLKLCGYVRIVRIDRNSW